MPAERKVEPISFTVLSYLLRWQNKHILENGGFCDAEEIEKGTGLSADEINVAVSRLEEKRFIEVISTLGTHPFDFQSVQLTSLGRVEGKRIVDDSEKEVRNKDEKENSEKAKQAIEDFNRRNMRSPEQALQAPPVPIGSPYGFSDHDWQYVRDRRTNQSRLVVVFGHQWESQHFDTDSIRSNLGKTFEVALESVKKKIGRPDIELAYEALAGGYGGHVFNEIARNIISADIAVFDASDSNPNVMIELGVALTWGVTMIPIRAEGSEKNRYPSDISGHTYLKYRKNGEEWLDTDHPIKLQKLIEGVIARKRR